MPGITSNMGHAELYEARQALGLTEAILGHFFGVDDRTVRRWSSGEWEIPISIAISLRLMRQYQLDPRDVYKMATGLELTGVERSRRASKPKQRPDEED